MGLDARCCGRLEFEFEQGGERPTTTVVVSTSAGANGDEARGTVSRDARDGVAAG